MELDYENLKEVVGGADPKAAEKKASENESLYRREQIEELKRQREEILKQEKSKEDDAPKLQ